MRDKFGSCTVVKILFLGLVLVVGCGGPRTRVEAGPREAAPPAETAAQKPVIPESPGSMPAVDYTTMQPSELGIRDVCFAYDNHELDDASMRILSTDARILKEHPDTVVMIEGHCDERGTFEYNLALGEKRANGVRDCLLYTSPSPRD